MSYVLLCQYYSLLLTTHLLLSSFCMSKNGRIVFLNLNALVCFPAVQIRATWGSCMRQNVPLEVHHDLLIILKHVCKMHWMVRNGLVPVWDVLSHCQSWLDQQCCSPSASFWDCYVVMDSWVFNNNIWMWDWAVNNWNRVLVADNRFWAVLGHLGSITFYTYLLVNTYNSVTCNQT